MQAKYIYSRGILFLLGILTPVLVGRAQPTLDNPLKSNSILCFIEDIVDALTYLAIPVIVIFIIIAGFKFVTAGGNEEKIGEAKRMALYTVIGAAIVLGASLLSDILINTAINLGVEIGRASCPGT
jgi:type IV secretory pathway VirB2 component (pilin)